MEKNYPERSGRKRSSSPLEQRVEGDAGLHILTLGHCLGPAHNEPRSPMHRRAISYGKRLLLVGLFMLIFPAYCGASGTNVSIAIQHAAILRGRAIWPHNFDWNGLTVFCSTVVDSERETPLACFAPYRTVFDSLFITAFDTNGTEIARVPYCNPDKGGTAKPRYFSLPQGRSTNELFFLLPNLRVLTNGLAIRLEGRVGGVSPEVSCCVTSSVVRVTTN